MKNQPAFCGTHTRRYFLNSCFVLIFSLGVLFPASSYCQEEPAYDEVIISLESRIVGAAEIPAIIYNNQAYLPVSDLFDFLKLSNSFSATSDSLYGFLLHQTDVFSISKSQHSILYKNIRTELPAGTIFFKPDDYYLRTDYFGKIFGLQCDFNFRSLSVTFDTELELPFMKEQRQQQMRLNLKRPGTDIVPDTIIKNRSVFLKPGMIDWDINATQFNGSNTQLARLGVGVGLLGGEANFFLNYNSRQAMLLKNQNYYWRYINNNASLVKQVTAGRVTAPGALSLYAPLNGIQLSNTSLRPKKSFGSILVSNQTERGWIVELYVNDAMVDYTRADANGNFSFEVPMMYGSCNIRYKFYGPFGEVRETSQQINIPFTFLQPGRLEYNLTAGITTDDEKNRFSKLSLNYGLAKRITIGSAVEYNSQAGINHIMPLLTASVRVGGELIIAAEHSPGIVSKANANYRFKDLQLEGSYTKYNSTQNVIRTGSLGEKKISVSMPLRFKNWGGFSRLIYNEIELYKGRQQNAEWMMAASFKGVNANITTSAIMLKPAYLQSRMLLSFKGPLSTRISPQLMYQYSSHKIAMWKLEAERRMGKQAIMNIAYEYNRQLQASGFTLSWRHDLSFMQLGGNMRNQDKDLFTAQYAGGSLFLNDKKVKASSQKNVGTGGFIIEAFLDNNYNGKKDTGEITVPAPIVKVDGAQANKDKRSMTVTLTALESFETYMLQLDAGNFENPSWRIEQKLVQLTVEPNAYKKINIPVVVAGEVAGYVYNKDAHKKQGLGRVQLNIFDERQTLVAKTLSEPDGYFSYMGLKPGRYSISADKENLEKLNKVSLKEAAFFEIRFKPEGDFVDSTEIILITKQNQLKSLYSFFSL